MSTMKHGAIVEEVEFCGCTNEELEAGRTCGQATCPNLATGVALILTVQDVHEWPSGIRRWAVGSDGRFYVDTPRRIKSWTCPAGVEHRRYWRSHGNPGGAREHYACEHTAKEVTP